MRLAEIIEDLTRMMFRQKQRQRNRVGPRSWVFFFFTLTFFLFIFLISPYVLGPELVTFFTCYIGTLGVCTIWGFSFLSWTDAQAAWIVSSFLFSSPHLSLL